jgi:hypothetical protein
MKRERMRQWQVTVFANGSNGFRHDRAPLERLKVERKRSGDTLAASAPQEGAH